MSSKLALNELRAQLAARGLSTSGIKPTLVRRLDSALQNEEMESKDAQKMASSVAGKRKREQQSGESPETGNVESLERLNGMNIRELRDQAVLVGISTNGSKRELVARLKEHMEKDMEETTEGTGNVESLERLNGMNIRELREQAVLVGISTNGSKRELVARLKEHMEKDMEETTEDMGENEDGKEKLITATKKGGAVLDQWLPDHIKLNYHVLERGDEVYDAILNQTNVGENNNKFYVIQVLEADAGGMFMVYNRWGRVGVKGQDKLHGPFISQENAIGDFQNKFFAKTRNDWFNRKEFISYPKCYTWLEMDYSQAEKAVVNSPDNAIIGIQPRETKLEPQIAKFISLICNISMMKQQMLEIGYNAEKLPLGKLSKATILKGYDVLKRISDVIGQSERKKLELLSGEFYTVIPHDFGFKKMREFIIDTPSKLKRKLEMVEALAEIEVATKLLKDDLEMQEDPLYSHYQRLCCQLTPLEIGSVEFSMVERYMQNTHAKTHSNYTVDIVHIFKVSRKGEAERFKKFSCMQNRMLLWHGSRLTNWTGILSQGLRIAPPEAPVNGYMFGKGVYFADMFSKSANYCHASRTSQTGVLLLCEVALGEMVELLTAKYDADQLPEGKLSTKGVGTSAPDSSASQSLEDGVVVPLGQPKEQSGPKGSLLYNEYIVYNTDQIRMRYVVQVNFNFKY